MFPTLDFYHADKKTKVIALAFECLFISVTSGLIFGFGALKNIFVSSGVFEWFCESTQESDGYEGSKCKAQNFHFTIMFSVGTLALNCIVLPVSPVTKYLGPKFTSLVSLATIVLGFLLLAFSTEDFNAFYCGFALMGAGGGAFFVTQFHFANLLPGREGMIGSFFAGSFNLGSVIFLALWYLYDATKASESSIFVMYSVVPLLVFLAHATFPSDFVPFQENEEELEPLKGWNEKTEQMWKDDDIKEGENQDEKLLQYNQREISLSSQFLSLDLLLFSLSFAWSVTCFNFYISEVEGMMEEVALKEGKGNDGSVYTLAFSWVLPFSTIFTIPISGFLIDRLGLFGSMFFINILALGCLVLYFVPILEIQPLAFFCVVEGRTLAFALGPSFMIFFVGVANYSTIFGAVQFLTGIFSLFIILFVYLSQHVFDGTYNAAILILLGGQIFTFASPVYFNYKNFKSKQRYLQAENAKENLIQGH